MKQKIVSIELPDTTYTLTKIKAVKNSPFIVLGQKVVGKLHTNPIKLEERCLVGDSFTNTIATSIVKKITLDKKNKSKIILKTENSVYELEEVDEIQNT